MQWRDVYKKKQQQQQKIKKSGKMKQGKCQVEQ